jgi:hypothetical protein
MDNFGELKPKYSFILNPYSEHRVSSCPLCQKLTHMRKFALLIYVEDWGIMTLGKTCRYCTPCELIIAHQDELEQELTLSFSRIKPEVIGQPYLVIGTIDKKVWKRGLKERPTFEETRKNTADFKKVLDLVVEPGGWFPKKE